jgi:hypothetical protein
MQLQLIPERENRSSTVFAPVATWQSVHVASRREEWQPCGFNYHLSANIRLLFIANIVNNGEVEEATIAKGFSRQRSAPEDLNLSAIPNRLIKLFTFVDSIVF